MISLKRAAILLLVLAPMSARATAITIDGKYADWAGVTTFNDPNDNQNNDAKSLAITDDLGADGKAGGTDHLYIKLEMWSTSGNGASQSIVLEYPDGTTDTFDIRLKSVSESSCTAPLNNCVSWNQTTDAKTGVVTWEMGVLFSDLSKSFAPAYTLKAYVSAKGAADRLPNAGTNVAYNAGTDLATSAQIVAQSAQELPGGVVVRWQTGAEIDNAGFFVWKRGPTGARPVSGLVHAAGAGGRGASYEVFDAGGRRGDVYVIEDVDDRGVRTLHPPIVAAPQPSLVAGVLETLFAPIHPRPAAARIPVRRPVTTTAPPQGAAVLGAASEGIYAVDPAELVAAGIDPAAVAAGRVSLARGGRWINLVAAPATGRKLLFYAAAPVNPYDGVDRYRAQPGPPMVGPVPRLLPPLGLATPSFVSTVVARQLQEYDWYQPGADPYAWQLIRPSARGVVSLALPDPAPGARGTISVHLTGGKVFDHAYDVVLNGTVLGTAIWTARDPYQGTFDIPAGVLDAAGKNVLEVRAQEGVSASDYIYLHDVTARYDRRFVASGDELSFEAPSGRTVVVSGFTRPDLVLLDVTDPAAPRSLPVQPFVDFTGHFSVAFRDPAGGVVRYRIAAAPALKHPEVRPAQDRLRLQSPAADLLIVTSDELAPSVGALVAARRAQGLMVEVVTVNEAYDAYSGGDAGPDGLRALVADALSHWRRAPRFLLLAGQGSMDPRGLLGGVDREQVPALFTVTRDYHQRAPSDVSYALEGGVVRMAVGRIPASTAAQLEGALAKILTQEAAPRTGHSLLVTDGPRDAVAFRSAGATMATVMKGASVLDAAAVPDAEAELALELPRSDLVTFVGHAWTGGWGGGATLLDAATAAAMVGGRAPFVVTSTCWESNFADWLGESVSANLLLDAQGGSSASFGPTTVLDLADHERLVSAVLEAAGSAATLGEAVQSGQQSYLDLRSDRPDPALTFVLLGDPSMRSPAGP